MKLYTYEVAPNPRRVKLFLQYKGITLETENVNLGEAEQLTDRFKAINPFCTVPTLVLGDGETLIDAVSIGFYLDQKYPEKPLFGTSALEQAQVLGWDHRVFTDGLFPIAEMLRNQGDFFKDRALPGSINIEQIPALIERGRKRLYGFFATMEKHLQGREFIVGEQLSFADIDVFVVCDFAGWVKETIPAECVTLQSWYQRVGKLLGEVD
ncbi:glutathione S-transferase family protein [Oceanicoccus sp. KOV_DT_Chl]|uniref:glutathione S-transferase family protein n=1 Tax=Oceanicoccus sp. KOV_DT_Chl TaxID=1904639 RepID=UPI000C7AF0D0|nr:glutathione S-transferase family protein [Oceanicoccus sp. KOV_DT_Chl]